MCGLGRERLPARGVRIALEHDGRHKETPWSARTQIRASKSDQSRRFMRTPRRAAQRGPALRWAVRLAMEAHLRSPKWRSRRVKRSTTPHRGVGSAGTVAPSPPALTTRFRSTPLAPQISTPSAQQKRRLLRPSERAATFASWQESTRSYPAHHNARRLSRHASSQGE